MSLTTLKYFYSIINPTHNAQPELEPELCELIKDSKGSRVLGVGFGPLFLIECIVNCVYLLILVII